MAKLYFYYASMNAGKSTVLRLLDAEPLVHRVEAAVLAASEGRLRDDMAILALGPLPAGESMLPRAPSTEEIDG